MFIGLYHLRHCLLSISTVYQKCSSEASQTPRLGISSSHLVSYISRTSSRFYGSITSTIKTSDYLRPYISNLTYPRVCVTHLVGNYPANQFDLSEALFTPAYQLFCYYSTRLRKRRQYLNNIPRPTKIVYLQQPKSCLVVMVMVMANALITAPAAEDLVGQRKERK